MTETDLLTQGVGNETEVADWKASLPEELKADPSLSPIKDITGLVKSYVNAQKLIGGEKVAIPKDESDGQWEVVYNRLGRPESPDKYSLVKPEGLPDYDEGAEKAFREQAHKLGLSDRQAKGLFEWYGSTAGEKFASASEAQKASLEQGLTALKAEWGQSFADKVAQAQKAVGFYGDDELKGFLNESGLGNHPAMVKLFAKLGSGLKEDGLRGTQGTGLAPADAKTQINSILNDRNHPYHDRYKPGHNEAVAEMLKLHEAASPQEV